MLQLPAACFTDITRLFAGTEHTQAQGRGGRRHPGASDPVCFRLPLPRRRLATATAADSAQRGPGVVHDREGWPAAIRDLQGTVSPYRNSSCMHEESAWCLLVLSMTT